MNDAITYLLSRISEGSIVRAQSPNANISAGVEALLEMYETPNIPMEDCEILFGMAYEHLQTRFRQDGVGHALLTAVSTAIGKEIRIAAGDMSLGDERLDWKRNISIGDLIIEALNHHDYIDLDFCRGQKAYLVYPTGRWQFTRNPKQWIRGTVFEPIKPITGLFQAHGRPVIKHWKHTEKELFEEYLDKPFVQALDNIQSQEWKLNLDVYKVLLKNRERFTTVTGDNKRQLQQSYSKVSEFRSIVSIASRVRKHESFWQYVECDYRGRVYFTQPFLNFQGSDYARGLFQFGKLKRVTAKGLKWIARHTACCFNESYHIDSIPLWCSGNYRDHLMAEGLDTISVDKMTMEDREKWTYMNMDKIIHNYDLLDCEKPVSFLACCFEWRRYHENPDIFYSRLPIPIDGSNNGWQHLAAISCDPQAGKLVGLVPVEIQEDFYVKTAKELIKLQPEWFEERQIPMKHIRKGISKRGSMTRAYSAGAGKIAENMYADCETAGYHKQYNIDPQDCGMLAKSLVKAIDITCPGPLKTMAYLQELATQELDRTGNDTITWTTPTGFPVIYEAPRLDKYRYMIRMRIDGKSKRINHVAQFPAYGIADYRKFMCGISPNFIHSIDASHMCMVVSRWGSAFGGVHDSFSTYADDVDDLQQLTKEVFVEFYTSDNNYKDIQRMILTDDVELDTPGLGSLDIRSVMNSDYFFA